MTKKKRVSNLYKMGGSRPKGSTTRTREEIVQVFESKGMKVDMNQEIRNDKMITAYTPEGYMIEARTYRMEQGIIPHIFGAHNPYTIHNIKEVWLPTNAPEYELLEDKYINNKHKMKWRLKDSDLPDFEMNWNTFQEKKRHPLIGKEIGFKNKRNTGSDVINFITSKIKDDARFFGWRLIIEEDYEYIDGEDVLIFRDESGYLACQTVQSIRNGYSLQRYSVLYSETSTYNLYLWNKIENRKDPLKDKQRYIGSNRKYVFTCQEHGEYMKWFSDALEGVGCRFCMIDANRGEGSPRWNPNLTSKDREDRRAYAEYKEWRTSVYERDSYTCQCCGQYSGAIYAHHKDGYHWCQNRRLDVTNGVVLCESCHITGELAFHRLYGVGNNTEEQYNEWVRLYQKDIIKLKKGV